MADSLTALAIPAVIAVVDAVVVVVVLRWMNRGH